MNNITDKCCKCEPFEVNWIAQCKDRSNCLYGNEKVQWDDKFGLIKMRKNEFNIKNKKENNFIFCDKNRRPILKKMIDGVGEDAEIVVNEAGGKQSKSPMAMHLVDPKYLEDVFRNKAEELEYFNGKYTGIANLQKYNEYMAIVHIALYMQDGDNFNLTQALDNLCDDEIQQVINIAKILQYGASRYAPNNWRLIPQEEHINHALIHIVAHLAGDTQDDHINHALCRLMMAKSTEKSENFEYGAYVA